MRQRRNRTATRSTLVRKEPPRQRAPSLPKRKGNPWHKMTRDWWRDVWHSPMAEQFLRADIHALYRLAALVDMFWRDPTKDLAAEIRLEQQAFGLSPIDRRRLQWVVEEEDERMPRRTRTPQAAGEDEARPDPRKILKMTGTG